jgi:hypothetical protein
MPSPHDLAAQIHALVRAIEAADEAAVEADFDWGDPDDKEAGRRFLEAVRHLHQLEAELAGLWRKVANGRFVHAGNQALH